MYKVLLTRRSSKDLGKLASADIQRTLVVLKKLDYPHPTNLDIKKMVDTSGFYRLRIGNIRIIFELDHNTKEIWIRKIAYRGSVY